MNLVGFFIFQFAAGPSTSLGYGTIHIGCMIKTHYVRKHFPEGEKTLWLVLNSSLPWGKR